MTERMNDYESYNSMVADVSTSVKNLIDISEKLKLEDHKAALVEVRQRLKDHTFKVGIMGEFRRGKSTVINALLGDGIVPTDVVPCSATLNRIRYDGTPHAIINFKADSNGRTPMAKEVKMNELASYVTKLTAESAKMAESVEDAVVYYPCKFCRNGVEIIDTPGLNDEDRMTKISESVIPSLDAIIMVIVPGSPFSASEAGFVRNKVMTSDLGRMIFVINKIDTIRERYRQKVIDDIKRRIQTTVLDKAAEIYGEKSEEYKTAKIKLGGIRVYPLSAIDAFDAKVDGDEDLLKKSGMLEFEQGLTKLLTLERGTLELYPVVSVVMGKLNAIDENLKMRANSLNMEKEQFETSQREAMEKIEKTRKDKEAKVKEIKSMAAGVFNDLQQDVIKAYNQIDDVLQEYVDNYSIMKNDFQDEKSVANFQSRLSESLNKKIDQCLQENTEKIQVKIQGRLSEVISELDVYSAGLENTTIAVVELMTENNVEEDVKSGTNGKKKDTHSWDKIDSIAAGTEALVTSSVLPGLGAAISGFKDHGVAGGLLGFGTGFAANIGSMATMITIAALAGAGSAVLLPIGIASGVLGTFVGKTVTNAVFDKLGNLFKTNKKGAVQQITSDQDWNQAMITIRNQLKQSVRKNIETIREKQVLENWLQTTSDKTFDALAERLDRETEETLRGLQETLNNIKMDINKNEVEKKSQQEKFQEYHEYLKNIMNMILPVKNKLDSVLQQTA